MVAELASRRQRGIPRVSRWSPPSGRLDIRGRCQSALFAAASSMRALKCSPGPAASRMTRLSAHGARRAAPATRRSSRPGPPADDRAAPARSPDGRRSAASVTSRRRLAAAFAIPFVASPAAVAAGLSLVAVGTATSLALWFPSLDGNGKPVITAAAAAPTAPPSLAVAPPARSSEPGDAGAGKQPSESSARAADQGASESDGLISFAESDAPEHPQIGGDSDLGNEEPSLEVPSSAPPSHTPPPPKKAPPPPPVPVSEGEPVTPAGPKPPAGPSRPRAFCLRPCPARRRHPQRARHHLRRPTYNPSPEPPPPPPTAPPPDADPAAPERLREAQGQGQAGGHACRSGGPGRWQDATRRAETAAGALRPRPPFRAKPPSRGEIEPQPATGAGGSAEAPGWKSQAGRGMGTAERNGRTRRPRGQGNGKRP